jgi:hypothetical protein
MSGFVVTPTGRGDGPFPLLVMPASWGAPNLEYAGAARKLAAESGDVPAGHHLALVVDSMDLRYTSESRLGTVKVHGSLTVPRR